MEQSRKEIDSNTVNFIAHIMDNNRFILYALKKEKHHTSCSTIFKLRPKTLRKYYNNDRFKLTNSKYKKIIEEYIN